MAARWICFIIPILFCGNIQSNFYSPTRCPNEQNATTDDAEFRVSGGCLSEAGKCLGFMSTAINNAYHAAHVCKSKGGRLLEIKTSVENTCFLNARGDRSIENYWLGLAEVSNTACGACGGNALKLFSWYSWTNSSLCPSGAGVTKGCAVDTNHQLNEGDCRNRGCCPLPNRACDLPNYISNENIIKFADFATVTFNSKRNCAFVQKNSSTTDKNKWIATSCLNRTARVVCEFDAPTTPGPTTTVTSVTSPVVATTVQMQSTIKAQTPGSKASTLAAGTTTSKVQSTAASTPKITSPVMTSSSVTLTTPTRGIFSTTSSSVTLTTPTRGIFSTTKPAETRTTQKRDILSTTKPTETRTTESPSIIKQKSDAITGGAIAAVVIVVILILISSIIAVVYVVHKRNARRNTTESAVTFRRLQEENPFSC